MPFTGVLGTTDSRLGNLELGTAGSPGRTTQNLQLRARIQNTSNQSLQVRARLTQAGLQSLQIRARIAPSLSLRARIAPGLSLRARLLSLVTSDLEVDYNVQGIVSTGLLVIYNATTATRVIQSLQVKSKIVPAVTAGLSVSFDLCYAMPAPPILRPTQRGEFRTVRTLTMKARIRTCSVVLVGNVYQTICS